MVDQPDTHAPGTAGGGDSPVLVCIDDLQWACTATLAALRTLPQELKRHPVAWILARSTAQRQEAEHLFALLESDGATRVRLGPFTEEEAAVLLTDAFGAPPHPGLRRWRRGPRATLGCYRS